MGWAARHRRESAVTDGRKFARYRVQRWTKFISEPDPARVRNRAEHLERMAPLVLRRLIDMYPRTDPEVAAVRDGTGCDLYFALTVSAADEQEARDLAAYYIGRSLTVRIARQAKRLELPWGRMEVVGLDG